MKVQALKERAIQHLRMNQFAQARELYQQAARLDPRDAAVWMQLGAVTGQMGNHAESEQYCRKALACDPRNAGIYHNLGMSLARQGKSQEAADSYAAALRLEPDRVATKYSMGLVLKDTGKFKEARTLLADVVTAKPDHAWAWFALGTIHAELGDNSEALSSLDRAATLDPSLQTRVNYFKNAITNNRAADELALSHVKELFDAHASSFEQHLVEGLGYRIPETLDRHIRQIIGDAPATLDILDIGCGTGICGSLLKTLARDLTGMDIAPRMIEQARNRQVYDHLLVGDFAPLLAADTRSYDIIIAADVFIYVGDVKHVFELAQQRLRPAGLLAFSVETSSDRPVVLRATGRYAHSTRYIEELAASTGFEILVAEPAVIRTELKKPIEGAVYVLRRLE
ncbi:MAG: tetratricopeptide repeat protein [Sulfuricaulis sp.]|uniref:tetratricopeptide repeat protein n=1 Tax=Sulfuricaulis sp. TaxID=2003553 RepID=UPI0025CF9863|nr:tetratricopeptide repeat protein [Sulfuricaulis sp.]MCR4347288.1 tetratricopeptide repeat protein [Sulfuricaulis sp.]